MPYSSDLDIRLTDTSLRDGSHANRSMRTMPGSTKSALNVLGSSRRRVDVALPESPSA